MSTTRVIALGLLLGAAMAFVGELLKPKRMTEGYQPVPGTVR